jgi:hypothetical protein
VDVGRREGQLRPGRRPRGAGAGGFPHHLATQRRAADARDSDSQGLVGNNPRRFQHHQQDAITDDQPADLFPQFGIVNAYFPPSLLDVFDLDGTSHS